MFWWNTTARQGSGKVKKRNEIAPVAALRQSNAYAQISIRHFLYCLIFFYEAIDLDFVENPANF